MQLLSDIKIDMSPLILPDVTRLERMCVTDDIQEIPGPVLDSDCNYMCNKCSVSLKRGKTPTNSLANGLWLGKVPQELKNLTYVEKMLIARVRHNRCIVRVKSSGRYKLRANAIVFQNPITKVYDVLPPPLKELDEVLACIFTGPCKPTKSDLKRTPLLVRRNNVARALKWLVLNHIDYQNIEISETNLSQYGEEDIPVVIDYRESVISKENEETSLHDTEDDDGIGGDCPFVVHGLSGEEYLTMTTDALKAVALEHLTSNQKVLFIGHSKDPISIFKNPQLFPSMMPWLFPYGLGGICNSKHTGSLSVKAHKKHLLMYHDKRFQMDENFPLIAWNHEQITAATTAGYLLANKAHFSEIIERLAYLDMNVLQDLINRLKTGGKAKPKNEMEEACYKLLNDVDIAGAKVDGTAGSKKDMRNQIWSLISYLGAPSWFITISPADVKHPICLYFADAKEEFKPEIMSNEKAFQLIANNPVAAARFFHFICEAFIKEVLGFNSDHTGIYGNIKGYYGTVEQQGRLTLHLHMLLWIENALSPQEIRDKILDKSSDFQQRLVQYLEAVHQGECTKGTVTEVKERIDKRAQSDSYYQDPTKTLPVPPPSSCQNSNCTGDCFQCMELKNWWSSIYSETLDDLIIRSNRHTCTKPIENDNGKQEVHKACLNKKGKCKARFPREVISETQVDQLTGAIKIKKGEAYLNTFTPVTTYLLRCNTDCTSLLSGTAIKAVVAYICDYISKSGLSAYTSFDTIRQVLNKNTELIGGCADCKAAARMLITKLINALTAKMEIGSPMASLYLLGNPDHYTSHKFIPFYWRNYVKEAKNAWKTEVEEDTAAKIMLQKNRSQYIGVSKVDDYIYCPAIYNDVYLYDWIRLSEKSKRSTKQQKIFEEKLKNKYNINSTDMNVDVEFRNGLFEESDSEDELNDLSIETLGGGLDNNSDSDADKLLINPGVPQYAYESRTEVYAFMDQHPQYHTHQIHFLPNNKYIVPNFMGGILPRYDQGDHEYYCLTMLSLFKPWRSGKDLKCENQTWNEAFNIYSFTTDQKILMKNFNVRYECNDARDDYSAQKNKEDNNEPQSYWENHTEMDHLNITDEMDYDDQDNDHALDDTDDYLTPCDKYLKKLEQMREIEEIIRNAGWLDKSSNGMFSIEKTLVQPSSDYIGTHWKMLIAEAKEAVLKERAKFIPVDNEEKPLQSHNYDEVIVNDISYINKHYHAEIEQHQAIIEDTIVEFKLNVEQERAFCIVANHATQNKSSQLKMYLGGMGGTGKSQVIKSLMTLFEKRNELHRIIILAPTGSAAALLNGSTYHSVLGVGSDGERNGRNEQTALNQVRTRLEGVDYIFIDEISMIACHELYKISAQLAKARNCINSPFGGLNMIFAGDFAQLKPVMGHALYNETVGTIINSAQTQRSQESAIGKALWHQVNTVVILKQNMRQKTQTLEDGKLRLALENMRYGACTYNDLKYLESRIAGKAPNQPKLTDQELHNVSIITARNAQKNQINELGSIRFAKETGQQLTHFYSLDTWGENNINVSHKKKRRYSKKQAIISPTIGPNIQEMLWNLHHSDTDHIAGKLSLCIGMPVMIRNNDATELCITKGQEGHVVGWESSTGPYDSKILDTLFVKLYQPAKVIQLNGLPENVVPLTRLSKSVKCITPSGVELQIKRSQIQVLPNFAMTDYACQGKTRLFNVVDLSYCRDHQSYYTCLSRSASSAGTVIIQGFNSDIITKGASGYLRQEFRELEILNEITKLIYEQNNSSYQFNGTTRNMLLRQYQNIQEMLLVLNDDIKQSSADSISEIQPITDSAWQIIDRHTSTFDKNCTQLAETSKFIPAKGTTGLEKLSTDPVPKLQSKKRKLDNQIRSSAKKAYTIPEVHYNEPIGLKWDEVNYSCAYDSLFTILCNLFLENPDHWIGIFHLYV